MKKRTDESNVTKYHDDKYNINDKFDIINSHSSTELTGLVRPAPANEEEIDSLNDIFTFKTEDIFIDKDKNKKKDKDKTKQYKYK